MWTEMILRQQHPSHAEAAWNSTFSKVFPSTVFWANPGNSPGTGMQLQKAAGERCSEGSRQMTAFNTAKTAKQARESKHQSHSCTAAIA